MTRTLTGTEALVVAWNTDGVPNPHGVIRVVIGDDQGRTTFYYDDGRDPWVLRGIEEVQQ